MTEWNKLRQYVKNTKKMNRILKSDKAKQRWNTACCSASTPPYPIVDNWIHQWYLLYAGQTISPAPHEPTTITAHSRSCCRVNYHTVAHKANEHFTVDVALLYSLPFMKFLPLLVLIIQNALLPYSKKHVNTGRYHHCLRGGHCGF